VKNDSQTKKLFFAKKMIFCRNYKKNCLKVIFIVIVLFLNVLKCGCSLLDILGEKVRKEMRKKSNKFVCMSV